MGDKNRAGRLTEEAKCVILGYLMGVSPLVLSIIAQLLGRLLKGWEG